MRAGVWGRDGVIVVQYHAGTVFFSQLTPYSLLHTHTHTHTHIHTHINTHKCLCKFPTFFLRVGCVFVSCVLAGCLSYTIMLGIDVHFANIIIHSCGAGILAVPEGVLGIYYVNIYIVSKPSCPHM